MASAEKSAGIAFRQELRAEFLRVHLRRLAERAGQQVRQCPGSRRQQTPPGLARIVRDGEDVVTDVLAAHARGISGPDQCADRRAGDGRWPHAHLVERFDHRDMRQPSRAARAEREREGFHAPGLLRKLEGLGGEWPHLLTLGRREGAGRGAVAHAAGDALHDRGETEEIVSKINRQIRPRVEAGARHISIDVSVERWNAERGKVGTHQRSGAGFRMRHVPLHQMIGEIRQRIAERGQFPIEHGGDARRVRRDDHIVEPVVAVHDAGRAAAAGHAPAARRSAAPSPRSARFRTRDIASTSARPGVRHSSRRGRNRLARLSPDRTCAAAPVSRSWRRKLAPARPDRTTAFAVPRIRGPRHGP